MNKSDEFFVGYVKRVPAGLRRFSLATGLLLVAAFALLGFAIGATQEAPDEGRFRFDLGRQTVTGILQAAPYPFVYITEGNERLPRGHALMLSAGGKNGVQGRSEGLDGQRVTVSGVLMTRGSLDMLQVRGGSAGIGPADTANASDAPLPTAPVIDHGRWRVAGEICDGKCLAGAMRPGRGVAHNACAQLCLAGGVPPVLATYDEVLGARFMMLGDADGGPLPTTVLRHTARPVALEGRIEQRGDLLVMLVDADALELLP